MRVTGKGWLRQCLILLFFALVLVIGLERAGVAERIDNVALGFLTPVLAPGADDRVVVVEIDKQSLDRLGRWPWPRYVHAMLIHRLTQAGVSVIGYDVSFAERSIIDERSDDALEAAVAAAGNVVFPVFAEPWAYGQPPLETLPYGKLPTLAAAIGHSHLSADTDGRMRRLSLYAGISEAYWPAFALAIARLALHGTDAKLPDLSVNESPPFDESPLLLGWIESEPRIMPTKADTIRVAHVSAADVLNTRGLDDFLSGKIVLVGATAVGLASWVNIDSGAGSSIRVPSLHFQAAALSNILNHRLLNPVRQSEIAAASLVLIGFMPLLLAGVARPRLAPAALNLLPLPPLTIGFVWLFGLHVVLPFASVTLLLLLILGALRFFEFAERLRQAQLERNLAHAALANVGDAVLTTDRANVVTTANPAASTLFTRPVETIVGQKLSQLSPVLASLVESAAVTGDHRSDPYRLLHESTARPAETGRFAIPITAGDGTVRSVKASMRRLIDGRVDGYVLALNDVTAEQRLLEELAFTAAHDGLTKLPNRNLILDRLMMAIERGRRQHRLVAVAMVDIDRLKRINDALGHAVGDAVLTELAERLRQAGRAIDTVGRVGGDEFVLLLENLNSRAEAKTAIERYRRVFAEPVQIDGQALQVRASIGVAYFPDDGDDSETLLRRADTAMYSAKSGGRDQLVKFDVSQHGDEQRGLLLDSALRQGISRNELVLHYQPRIDLVGRRASALESLVRWQHPDFGFLPPARFIGLAEETGSIVELGRWVLDRACADLVGPSLRQTNLRLSVNISVVQLKRDQGFVDFVRTTLARHGLGPDRLELEVTESLFLDPSLPMLGGRLAELARLGVHLSIDDFGTGYSSLAYIDRFPFDRVKVDRSFVHALGRDQGSQAIVKAILSMCDALNKATTAEGVEEEAQLAFLDHLNCNEAQGYLLGRPEPLSTLTIPE